MLAHRFRFELFVCSLGFILLGCRQASIKDYVPDDAAARAALTTALDGWKSGKAPDGQGP